MRKTTPIALILAGMAALSSCTTTYHQQAFYVSPYNGSSEAYHTLPMHTDTVQTAVYGRISGFGGYANTLQTDHTGGGNASIYVAHHGTGWQAYYGIDATLGSYTLGNWRTRTEPGNFNPLTLNFIGLFNDKTYTAPSTAAELNNYSGTYTYGGLGFSGGFNGVIPMGQGEWRFIGIETALHREYGQYRNLRRQMPDSIAGYIGRNSFFGTLGLTSEWIFRTKTGDFGFRLAGGWVLGSGYRPADVYDSVSQRPLRYGGYGSFSAHYTTGRYTIVYQTETATKGNSYSLGFIYRFGDPKLPARKPHYRQLPPTRPDPPRPRFPFGH